MESSGNSLLENRILQVSNGALTRSDMWLGPTNRCPQAQKQHTSSKSAVLLETSRACLLLGYRLLACRPVEHCLTARFTGVLTDLVHFL